MIDLFVQSTHFKVFYDNATDAEVEQSERLIKDTFQAEDHTLRNSPMVKRGLASPIRSFYISTKENPRESENLLLTGFLDELKDLYDQHKIQYTVRDSRKYPTMDKVFLRNLRSGDIKCKDYEPRDYQIEAVMAIAQSKGGILSLSMGCVAGDTIINENRCRKGAKKTIEQMYNGFNKLYKNKKYNYNDEPTYVRSYIKDTDRISLNKIKGVYYSGVKFTLELILENGYSIRATPDHKILTSSGWKELQYLTNEDYIMCDTPRPIKGKPSKKIKDKLIGSLWFHPYAVIVKSNKDKRGYTKRIELHRAIYEAHINGLTLDEYKYILRNDEKNSKTLNFINPKIECIHHVDKNHFNNDINNLCKMSQFDHALLHSKDTKINFHQGVPQFSKVVSVSPFGEIPTYDISCCDNHNFVANGMVVHNSGKTLISYLLTKLFPKVKILMLFDGVELIHQTYRAFVEDYGMSKDEVGIIQGSIVDDEKRVLLLSVDSYEKAMEWFPYTKVIILDEAHQIGSSTGDQMATRVMYSCQNATIRVGLSATPDVIDNPYRQKALYGNLGPIVYKKTIKEQVDNQTLASMEVEVNTVGGFVVPIVGSYADIYETKKITLGERDEYEKKGYEILYKNEKYYARKFLAYGDDSQSYVFNERRNKIIADSVLAHSGRRVVLFTRTEHGKILQKLIPGSIMINGEDDITERNKAKKYLLDNPNGIVLASSIWNQGIDIKWIEVLFLAGAGVSSTQTIQKFGRALRKSSETGKTSAKFVDFYDSFNPLCEKQSKKRLHIYQKILGFKVNIK